MNIIKEYLDENPLLYKHTLLPHLWYGWMWDFNEVAEHAGYKFFMWNDTVYHTKDGRVLTIEQLEEESL